MIMENKELLLEMCHKIVQADRNSIEILRNTPISNIKALRKQKTTANVSAPLVSTMTNMYRTFPLSVDRLLALKYKIPEDFLLLKEDTHTANRVLCKREALQWWTKNSDAPSEETIDMIHLVYKGHFKKTEDFHRIKWNRSRIQWGPTVLERKAIVIREASIQIDRAETTRTCLYILGASPVEPRIGREVLQEVKMIRDASISNKMTFFAQYSILLANLRNDIRMLPTSTAVPPDFARFSYAVLGTNYTITGVNFAHDRRLPENKELWTNSLYRAFYLNIQHANATDLEYVSIQGVGLRQILRDDSLQNQSSRYIRTLLGIETYLIRDIHGVLIDIEEHNPRYQYDKLLQIWKDTTRHAIHFKYEEARGYAKVFLDTLEYVTINKCSNSSFNKCMAAFAVYIGKDLHRKPKKTSLERFQEQVFNYYHRYPFHVIDKTCNLIFDHDMKASFLTFAETEFTNPIPRMYRREGNTLTSPKGLTWTFEKPKGDCKMPNDAIIPSGAFEDAFDPIKALRRRVRHFILKGKEIMQNVRRGNFRYLNQAFSTHMSQAEIISLCCRSSCEFQVSKIEELDRSTDFNIADYKFHLANLAVFYCFCYPVPALAVSEVPTNFTFFEQQVDLTFGSGLITMSSDGLKIGGVVLESDINMEGPQYYLGFLRGFRMRKRAAEDTCRPLKMRKFKEIRETMSEGESVAVMLDQPYILTKDSSFGSQIARTLKRNYATMMLSNTGEDIDEFLIKEKKRREENEPLSEDEDFELDSD